MKYLKDIEKNLMDLIKIKTNSKYKTELLNKEFNNLKFYINGFSLNYFYKTFKLYNKVLTHSDLKTLLYYLKNNKNIIRENKGFLFNTKTLNIKPIFKHSYRFV